MASRYPGVTAQKKSIRIEFTYKGIRCRESIKIVPTDINLKQAQKMRDVIQFEIGMQRFKYADHFPDSKNALRFSNNKSKLINVGTAHTKWMVRKQAECELSTIKDYSSSIVNYLNPRFGHLTLDDIKPSIVKDWLTSLDLSNKRKNNILIPLRGVFEDAYYDEVIETNPMTRVKNLKVVQKEPKPFTLTEIEAILSELDGQEKNYFHLAFWTGLRTSELIGLRWEDVDFETDCLHIRRAIVGGVEKTTKTKSGLRTIELNEEALTALLCQKQYTYDKNNWIFHDPQHDDRWKNENPMRKRVWIPALKNANVKYRCPYQTRHTFASMMLSKGKNPMWVAQQMGHSDWGMIRKVYGRWIAQG